MKKQIQQLVALNMAILMVMTMTLSAITLPVRAADENTSEQTVTFYGNGGKTQDGGESVVCSPESLTAFPDEKLFSREGYVQIGWNMDSEATADRYNQNLGETSTFYPDTSYYAVWVERPTTGIVYHGNGGWVNYSSIVEEVDPGNEISLNKEASRSSFRFCGWSTKEDQMSRVTSVTLGEGECIDLYAIWGVNSSIAIGTVTTTDGNMTLYAYPAKITLGDGSAIDPTEESSGTGWQYKDGCLTLSEGYEGDTIHAAYDLALKIDGNVSISCDSGPAITAGNCVHIDYTAGSSLTLSGETYGVQCKNFYNGACGTLTVTGTEAALKADYIALSNHYPEGLENALTAGGSEEMAVSVTEYGDQKYLRAAAPQIEVTFADSEDQSEYETDALLYQAPLSFVPEKAGYIFMGWTKNLNGTEEYYTTCDFVEDTTLYAQWCSKDCVLLDLMGKKTWMNIDNNNYGDYYKVQLKPDSDGRFTLPEGYWGSLGWAEADEDSPSYAPTCSFDFDREKIDDILWAGESYVLTPGTILCALYAPSSSGGANATGTYLLYGNGGVTANNQPNEVIRYQYYTTNGDLVSYEKGKGALPVDDFTNEGKVLTAWNTSSNGSGTECYPGQFTGDYSKFYAQWEDTVSGSAMLYGYDGELEGGKHYLQTADLQDASDPHGFSEGSAAFLGWYQLYSGEDAEAVNTLEPDQAYYAKWGYYTASYYDKDSKLQKQVTATKDGFTVSSGIGVTGYLFNGWNTEADGTGDWYYSGQDVSLPGDLDLYAQYIENDSAHVFLKANTGDFNGQTYRCYALDDSITLPVDSDLTGGSTLLCWYDKTNDAMYEPGETVTFDTAVTLLAVYQDIGAAEKSLVAFGNGGTTPKNAGEDGAETGGKTYVYLGYGSYDSIYTPTKSPFSQEGYTMTGWNTRADGSGTSYGSNEYCNYRGVTLYAQWRNDAAVDLTFTDDKNVQTQTRLPGDKITLPTLTRAAHTFDGWLDSDGTLHEPGEVYTVTGTVTGTESFTAQWTRADWLVIGGGEYDPAVSQSGDGWEYYVNGTYVTLTLNGYVGPEIVVPGADNGSVDFVIEGNNTIRATDGHPAIEVGAEIYIQSNSEGLHNLTAVGGSGCPAIYAQEWINLRVGDLTLIGGEGQPALRSDNREYYGESGNSTVWFNYCTAVAGSDAESAVSITEYENAQHYLHTEPVYYTLTLQGNGGKYHGRSSWKLSLEAGIWSSFEECAFEKAGAVLTGFLDERGNTYTKSISLDADTTLTAQYKELGFDQYVIFDEGNDQYQYVKWSPDGITAPECKRENPYGVFRCWYIREETQDSNGETYYDTFRRVFPGDVVKVPAGTVFKAGWTDEQNANGIVYDANGREYPSGETVQIMYSTSFELYNNEKYSADGAVVEYYSLDPEGTQKIANGDAVAGADSTVVWVYAQWHEYFTVTVPASGELTLKSSTEETQKFYNATSVWANIIGWRTEDWSSVYTVGETVSLPAGTTLYAICSGRDTFVVLTDETSGTNKILTDGTEVALRVASLPLYREGYTFAGWNTKPDGTGKAYAANGIVSFPCEKIRLPDEWTWDDVPEGHSVNTDTDSETGASYDYYYNYTDGTMYHLYAQWEKEPDVTIEVPEAMLEALDAEPSGGYLIGFYKNDCLVKLVTADAGPWELTAELEGVEYDRYTLFCVGGKNEPLTAEARFQK